MMSADKSERSGLWETTANVVGRVVAILIVMCFVFGGFFVVWKYLNRRRISHDKLTVVHYHGGWSVGEYRDCHSMNVKEDKKEPELYCANSSAMDAGKVFRVRFSGDLTYDKDKQEGTVHYWRCRYDGDADPTITCAIKEKSVDG